MGGLAGGVSNGGAVVRVGDTVRRPARPLARAVVQHLEAVGFERAPRFLGVDGEGRDVFTFVEGDVAVAPYPAWARQDAILREVGQLLREFHTAMAGFEHEATAELADPAGGPVFCHNDLCPENVVFRDGRAVALLDFDVAAPGRALWDVARTARMWLPAAVPGTSLSWPGRLDVWQRAAVLTGAYGVGAAAAEEFADLLIEATRQGQDWVRAKVAAGEPSFVEMWQQLGLAERYAADLSWITAHRADLAAVITRGETGS
jgi:Ser/Thr protein kinase RdoA (MazF antagonist)